MRVLVTGGTGYLGQAIVRALARHGHHPIVFARAASAARDLPGTRIDGDVRDRPAVRDAMRGADAVIHAAALVSIWRPDPADFDRINVGGLETVVDVCVSLGTPRLVYTSSFLALPPAGGTPPPVGRARPLEANEYQRSKVRAREVARRAANNHVPIVTLVPGVIYGPGIDTEANLVGRLVRDHLARRLPGVIGADRIWSFSYIDDVADAHVAALTNGPAGAEYAVGGENAPQIRLFEILRDQIGYALPRRIPAAVAHVVAWADERATRGRRPPRLTRGAVRILHADWPLDSRRSVDELNYRMTPLETGLRSVVAVGA
jgi:nucleoside-diphosphate-sugar epimerase